MTSIRNIFLPIALFRVYTSKQRIVKLEKAIKQEKFTSNYQRLMVNVAYTNSYLSTIIAARLKPYDLSMQQYNVLRILRGQHPKPVSVNSITERMIDKMSNASRLVEKLRKKSLIERNKCESDRRQVDVSLTQKGLDTLQELDDIIANVEGTLKHLTEEEVKTLNNLLDRIRTDE